MIDIQSFRNRECQSDGLKLWSSSFAQWLHSYTIVVLARFQHEKAYDNESNSIRDAVRHELETLNKPAAYSEKFDVSKPLPNTAVNTAS